MTKIYLCVTVLFGLICLLKGKSINVSLLQWAPSPIKSVSEISKAVALFTLSFNDTVFKPIASTLSNSHIQRDDVTSSLKGKKRTPVNHTVLITLPIYCLLSNCKFCSVKSGLTYFDWQLINVVVRAYNFHKKRLAK